MLGEFTPSIVSCPPTIPVRLLVRRVLVCWFLVGAVIPQASADEAYKWSVQYLIDNSQPVFGRKQALYPRRNRGLAISPDGRYLYAGYHQSFNGTGEVRQIDTRQEDYSKATRRVVQGLMPKAVAVDDEGRVYVSDREQILIYDANLSNVQCTIDTVDVEGLAITREGGHLIVYGSDRSRCMLTRWELQTSGSSVTGAVASGFSGDGELTLEGAVSLRGVAIDPKGRIWIADLEADKIFRVADKGKDIQSAEVKSPMDITFNGSTALVTQNRERVITLLDEEMAVTGTLSVPWEELALAPFGNNRSGALSGIAVVPGHPELGFYVANEGGQTSFQRSTYGREDKHSGTIEDKFFTDKFIDDNEPILRALPVGALLPDPAAAGVRRFGRAANPRLAKSFQKICA